MRKRKKRKLNCKRQKMNIGQFIMKATSDSVSEYYGIDENKEASRICVKSLGSVIDKSPQLLYQIIVPKSMEAKVKEDLKVFDGNDLLKFAIDYCKSKKIELTDASKHIISESKCYVYAVDMNKFLPEGSEFTEEQMNEYLTNNLPDFVLENLL